MSAKTDRIHYAFELADYLGVTLAELVGPENVHKHPANLFQARVLEAMQELPEEDQEALVAMVAARQAGMVAPAEFDRILQLPHAKLWEHIRAWHATLTPEQAEALRRVPEQVAA